MSPLQDSLRVSGPGAQLTPTRLQQPPERRVNLGGGVPFVRKGKILSSTRALGKLVPEQAFKSGFFCVFLFFVFKLLHFCVEDTYAAYGGQRTTVNSRFLHPVIHMLRRLNSGH